MGKLVLAFFFFVMLSPGCSSGVNTKDKSVHKIVTTTEYLLLNNDFNFPDTTHQQKDIKKYDEHGNMLENMEYWGETVTFGGGGVYKYDSQNRVIEEYHLDVNNRVSAKYYYEYSGSEAIQYELYEDNSTYKRKINQYDSRKNMIKETVYDNTGAVMYEFHYKYNPGNQEIERSGTISHKKVQTNLKSYDGLSNLAEQKAVDSSGMVLSVEKFSYEQFDKYGNWEIRKSMLNGVPHSIAFRKVETR